MEILLSEGPKVYIKKAKKYTCIWIAIMQQNLLVLVCLVGLLMLPLYLSIVSKSNDKRKKKAPLTIFNLQSFLCNIATFIQFSQ